jgi:hypothetical protein
LSIGKNGHFLSVSVTSPAISAAPEFASVFGSDINTDNTNTDNAAATGCYVVERFGGTFILSFGFGVRASLG